MRDKHHRLQNAPNVDNSCKWAGGGFVSNIDDLLKFGNAMLYSYQYEEKGPQNAPETTGIKTKAIQVASHRDQRETQVTEVAHKTGPFHNVNQPKIDPSDKAPSKRGFLKRETMELIWQPWVYMAREEDRFLQDATYGMGWAVTKKIPEPPFCRDQRTYRIVQVANYCQPSRNF